VPDDTLDEYISRDEWFNAFKVIAPSGESRGWYANVTYPSRIEPGAAGPTLYWHDLYVDVVVTNDGTIAVLDEDELAESGLAEQNRELHKKILATRDLILRKIMDRNFPFDQ
jgi:predicted RNA-binding protein associated with RNAse of E/G family